MIYVVQGFMSYEGSLGEPRAFDNPTEAMAYGRSLFESEAIDYVNVMRIDPDLTVRVFACALMRDSEDVDDITK